jgi:hypothetical protein
LTFAELKTELQARGFDYLSDTRQGYFLNRSYQEMAGSADYPWLESTASGAAPLAITDLRTIESVVDSTAANRLSPLDRRNIMENDDTLATTGTPSVYYLTTGTTVAVYPTSTNTLSVRYWKAPTDLTSASDSPGFPARFHHLIVDGATYFAYLDSDNFEAAGSVYDFWLRGRKDMDEQLLVGQHDQADDFIWATNSVDG